MRLTNPGFLLLVVLLLMIPSGVNAAESVEVLYFNPPGCPITIYDTGSMNKDPRVPLDVMFEYPDIGTGIDITVVKFNVVMVDTFDNLHYWNDGYTEIGDYEQGRSYEGNWDYYPDNAESLYQIYVIPSEVHFSDQSTWVFDTDAVREWLTGELSASRADLIDFLIAKRRHYFNPLDCPITIITFENYWHGAREGYYGYSYWTGNYWVPGRPAGISTDINYIVTGDEDDLEIIAVNFKVWRFNDQNQYIESYNLAITSGEFRPNRITPYDWEHEIDEGSTSYRSVIFVSDIRFEDESTWTIDEDELCDWFSQEFDGAERINCGNLFNPHQSYVSETENIFFNSDESPITITGVDSAWRAEEDGIWYRLDFECNDDLETGIVAAKFALISLNAFDEIIYNATGYATYGPYRPGETIYIEWVGRGTTLGSTISKSLVYPLEIRFENGDAWSVDTPAVLEWFRETMALDEEPLYEDIFPEENEQLERYDGVMVAGI